MKIADILSETPIGNVAKELFDVVTTDIVLTDRRTGERRRDVDLSDFKFTFKKFPSVIGLLDDLKLPVDTKSPHLDRLTTSTKVANALKFLNSLIGQQVTNELLEKAKRVIADIAPEIALYKRSVEK